MLQTPQVVFHGISRSPAVENAVSERVEALTRFDSRLGTVRATISLDGHQTTNEFNVRLDFVTSGKNVVINCKGTDVIAALNDAFDKAERSVKEEAAKLRQP
ncbi:MAG: HPF/RaiA family ribosome-associated protein [Sutterellaceae bacterium]|nr:HPF/RaiA family ribosome-associated protein [Sutterellaceae bacterium]MDD7442178.1 HPF/RaiA family ribosome-associated protein [Sutterellaceae bacterium]MDY2868173.1 HPF/RaiA family ribosome-associated protein [Mesosutterella sp.]